MSHWAEKAKMTFDLLATVAIALTVALIVWRGRASGDRQ